MINESIINWFIFILLCPLLAIAFKHFSLVKNIFMVFLACFINITKCLRNNRERTKVLN